MEPQITGSFNASGGRGNDIQTVIATKKTTPTGSMVIRPRSIGDAGQGDHGKHERPAPTRHVLSGLQQQVFCLHRETGFSRHRPELQDNRNLLLTPGNWGVWRTASSRGGGKLMSGCARVACASCARAMKQLCPVALDHAELPCRPYYQCPRWTSSR